MLVFHAGSSELSHVPFKLFSIQVLQTEKAARFFHADMQGDVIKRVFFISDFHYYHVL